MKFCPECGDKIADNFTFCPSCGTDLNQLKGAIEETHIVDNDPVKDPEQEISIAEPPSEVEEEATENENGFLRTIGGILVLVAFVCGIVLVIMFVIHPFGQTQTWGGGPVPLLAGQTTPTTTMEETQYEKNVKIVKEIAQEYYDTHTYMGVQSGRSADMYVCVDMAKDVWNMVKTRGINAVIEVGSVDTDISKISEATHAWVLAEVGPEQWLAIETTGGFVVNMDANPRYYAGWRFDNPSDLKKYSCGENYCFSGTCINGKCVGCEAGYVIGDDLKCHPECGSGTYCTGNSVCINGQCKGCNSGYILGNDYQCHPECGSGTYCTGDSICVNGECRGCSSGYILGDDLQCHPECSPGRYCVTGTCYNGQCLTCQSGYYLGVDGRCHSY